MAMAVYTAQLFEAVNSHHVSRGCDLDVHVPVLRSFMAKEAIADYRRRTCRRLRVFKIHQESLHTEC